MRALLALLILCMGTAWAQTDKRPLLTVSGTGVVLAKPDQARVTLGVETRGQDAAIAAKQNAQRLEAVIAALRKLGIESKDIQTVGFGVQATETGSKTRQVSNALEVTIRKLTDAGKVVDAALKAGANTASDLAFELTNPEPLRDLALKKAVQDGQRKAKALLEAAGGSALVMESLSEEESTLGEMNGASYNTSLYPSRVNTVAGERTPITSNRLVVSARVRLEYRLTIPAGKE